MITIEMELAIGNIESELAAMETELEKAAKEMDTKMNKMSPKTVFKMAAVATTISNMKTMMTTLRTTIDTE